MRTLMLGLTIGEITLEDFLKQVCRISVFQSQESLISLVRIWILSPPRMTPAPWIPTIQIDLVRFLLFMNFSHR